MKFKHLFFILPFFLIFGCALVTYMNRDEFYATKVPASLDTNNIEEYLSIGGKLKKIITVKSSNKNLLRCEVRSNESWIYIEKSFFDVTGDTKEFNILLDAGSIKTAGTYSSNITVSISHNGEVILKQDISVKMILTDCPVLSFNCNKVEFGNVKDNLMLVKSIAVSNTGTQPLDWDVTCDSNIFSLSKLSGSLNPGELNSIQVSINTSGFSVSNYNAKITFNSKTPNVMNGLKTIDVLLSVIGPTLAINPGSINLTNISYV